MVMPITHAALQHTRRFHPLTSGHQGGRQQRVEVWRRVVVRMRGLVGRQRLGGPIGPLKDPAAKVIGGGKVNGFSGGRRPVRVSLWRCRAEIPSTNSSRLYAGPAARITSAPSSSWTVTAVPSKSPPCLRAGQMTRSPRAAWREPDLLAVHRPLPAPVS